ncbi:MAG: ribonuclease Y [Acidobacteria bacterium]|nr:ribonuclease Y [Acidobacteriota bacterium]
MFTAGLLISIAVLLAAGITAFYLTRTRLINRKLAQAEAQARRVLQDAQVDTEKLRKEKVLEAKEEIYALRSEFDSQVREGKRELGATERRLSQKEENLNKRESAILEKEKELEQRSGAIAGCEKNAELLQQKCEVLIENELRSLERVSGMTVEEAKKQLLRNLEVEAMRDGTMMVKRIEEEAHAVAQREARKIIVQAIQRCAAEHAVESTVSVVDLPNEEMKGRIIGREGRNIRALEQTTGVDLIVDDTPGAIILSGFDPLRREVARMAIEELLNDGRIHPARIEEVVEKARAGLESRMIQEGEAAAFEVGVRDLHPGIIKMLGRLKYRTSYGQNVLDHSIEVAYLAGIMAAECRANSIIARRAGLLHDIGKAVDRDIEGTHIQLGVEMLRRFGESPEVIHAMECHHFDVEFRSLEAVLVQAADAVSAARPGARREILESYVKRLEKLESLAESFSGVAKAFALQAGREIRIIVESSKVSDEQALWLTKDITKKIESELQYPGQIKVTVIREMRVVDYAR